MFCLIYIGWLSKLALVITVGAIAAATLIYFIYRREVIKLLKVTTEKETELFDSLSHVINGFKELKSKLEEKQRYVFPFS